MMRNLRRREFVFKRWRIVGRGNIKERIKTILTGVLIVIAIAFFFYRSVWAIPAIMPIGWWYQKEATKTFAQKKQKETAIQFKDAILAVSANQKAGYSVENSFRQAYQDMVLLYGRESIICREFYTMIIGMENNLTLEKMLYDFGKRSDVEEIKEFAEVFAAAKRNGGNLTEVIERSAIVIEEKVETENEIQILISARKLEQKIMNVVPFGILLYVGITSKGFFDVLYHNLIGIIIMTVCLLVYIGAIFLSKRIVDIEV